MIGPNLEPLGLDTCIDEVLRLSPEDQRLVLAAINARRASGYDVADAMITKQKQEAATPTDKLVKARCEVKKSTAVTFTLERSTIVILTFLALAFGYYLWQMGRGYQHIFEQLRAEKQVQP